MYALVLIPGVNLMCAVVLLPGVNLMRLNIYVYVYIYIINNFVVRISNNFLQNLIYTVVRFGSLLISGSRLIVSIFALLKVSPISHSYVLNEHPVREFELRPTIF
jgi:hypothetical protein